MPTLARTFPYAALALKYAEDVLAGRILACRWTHLACERQLRDMDRWRGKDQPFRFDPAAGNRVCDILQRFPHIKGIWAQHRKRLELEAWQCFLVCVVFGWLCLATAARRFR